MTSCRRILICAFAGFAAIAAVRNMAQGQGRIRRGIVPLPVEIPVGDKTGGDKTGGEKTEPAEEADDDDAPDGTRSFVLPDNGDLRRKLEKVRQQIDGEHYADAARALGQFLQSPDIHDFFLSRDDQRRDGRSFLAEVRRLLNELPAAGKTAYREQFEAAARTQLTAAIAAADEQSLRSVAARFPETRAGDEALYRLGHVLRDHGRAQAAAACLKRLQGRPEAAAAFEPALSRALAACTAQADQLGPEAAFHDWATFRGNAARNSAVAARPPFLAPRWSRQVASDAPTQLAIERSTQAYMAGSGTALPMLNPLAVGDLLFVRTARGVAAYDLETGASRWSEPSDDDRENAGLDRILWQEPAGGAFSADEECVYLVDGFPLGDLESNRVRENTLSAREHFRSREGNLRWQIGGRDGGNEPRLTGVFFLGPPLAWQGGLYVLAEAKGALSLVALDRLTGRLTWSQELALVEQRISEDLLRLVGGATPTIAAEEIVVCPTSGGVVVALDLTTRSLLWAYRYVQKAPVQPASVDDSDTAPRLDQFDRWLDGTLSIAAGRVVLTPLESREIHCLDLKDGRPLWTKARDDGMFVACVTTSETGDLAVVVGRSAVRAHRLSDGEVAWKLPLAAGSFPSGRGVFAAERYYLPVTSAAVLEVVLADGSLAASHKSPRELPAGNLIWHNGLFVSQGPATLDVFDEREAVVDQVRDRLASNPHDSEALLRRGELELSAGNLAEAIAAFRRAHTAARSPKTKSRLIATLLDGVRREIPGHEELSAELDALIGP